MNQSKQYPSTNLIKGRFRIIQYTIRSNNFNDQQRIESYNTIHNKMKQTVQFRRNSIIWKQKTKPTDWIIIN